MSFSFFLRQLVTNPALLITVLLTLGVVCIDGVMDTPNAIATCVSTRSLDVNLAIAMVAVCNCAGVVVTTIVNSVVAMIITNMANFGGDVSTVLITLCIALFSIMVWSPFAVPIGCPASESHALIAGLIGAAVAVRRGSSAINSAEWIKAIYGLTPPVVLGFSSDHLSCRLVVWACRDMDRRKATGLFRYTQIGGAATTASTHGAQDGQKFMGVMPLGVCVVNGSNSTQGVWSPLWTLLLGLAAMALGTSIGGKKVVRSVGMDMIRLEKYQDFSAGMAGAVCLLGFSISGVPVSTAHTKITAIMGVGVMRRLSAINLSAAKDMVMTWIMTLPGYGVIGFLMTRLFMMLFHR